MACNRSDLVELALTTCTVCQGVGARAAGERGKGRNVPPCDLCTCVLRAVFRTCYSRFKECVFRGKFCGPVSFERASSGRSHRGMWSRKEEEYMADFDLVARRRLDKCHYQVFKFHFLLGASWKICCGRLGLERGNFYHTVYRIEQQVGEAILALEPYSLYPPRDYFASRLGEPAAPLRPDLLRPGLLRPAPRRVGRDGTEGVWVDLLAG